MLQSAVRSGMLDRLAIGLSGLCLVHCVASAVLVDDARSAGGLLLDPVVHEFGLMLAIVSASLGLGRGILQHGFMMPVAIGSLGLGTMAGALTLDMAAARCLCDARRAHPRARPRPQPPRGDLTAPALVTPSRRTTFRPWPITTITATRAPP